jgi:DNA replication protein DnaC
MTETRGTQTAAQEDMRETLQHSLKELHLSTIRERFEQAARQAAQESLGYESYLSDLVQSECEVRRQRRIERFLRESHLPLEKTLELFELRRLPPKVVQQVKLLEQGFFLDTHENVLVFGNPGTGKTHLLCGIAQALVRQGRRIWFSSCALLVQKLLVAKRDLALAQVLKTLRKFDAIVIDDIGYVQHNQEEMEVLFTLLAERYERGSVMISSNLAFSQWDKIFKDPMTTVAAIDRVVHHSVILELNMKSYRMEQAQKRNQNVQVEGNDVT